MYTVKNVTLPDGPTAGNTVIGVLNATNVYRTVSYTIKGYDAARGTVTYTLEGPADDVHLAYEYGAQNRIW